MNKQRQRCYAQRLGIILTASALVACFGGEGQPTASVPTTLLIGVTPTKAVLGEATTYTVTGLNLPLTANLSMVGGVCLTPTNRAATGFTVVCTAGGAVGTQTLTINSDTAANNGWWLGAQTITTTAAATAPLTVINLLVDSGVNAGQCYAAGSDVLVSCISPSAIALNDKQDGMTGRDVTSADGADGQYGLSYAVVGSFAKTSCVRDNVTGLMWQAKSTALLKEPGDARNLEAKTVETATNAIGLCGYVDWRLPTRSELQSLVNYGSNDLYFSIDVNWFADTKVGAYYSATRYAPNVKNVWLVDFIKGNVAPDSTASSGVYVRLVR
jgi:hypothetical protein